MGSYAAHAVETVDGRDFVTATGSGRAGLWPSDVDCTFCRITDGTDHAEIVYRWSDAIAFTPLNPVTEGHVLVIPKVHVRDAIECPPVTAFAMARAAELAAGMVASNILTSVGRAATQSIFHLHIHVIPRAAGDQLMVPWGTTGDPHAPHRCKRIDELEADLRYLRRTTLTAGTP